MLTLLLRKSTEARRSNSAGEDESCPRHVEPNGKRHGQCSTVRTDRGNLTITQGDLATSVGYDENTIRRTAGRRKQRSSGARNRLTTNPSMGGKLSNVCRCGRPVIPAYHLEGRCENCWSDDQQRYDGKSRNLRLFHTVR